MEADGRISVVGPAWFFADTAQVVYDLDEPIVEKLDEVFHGGLFNENRRIESIKAHTALGGRLVHGSAGEEWWRPTPPRWTPSGTS